MPRPQGAAEPATHSTLRFQARAWLRGLLIAVGCVSVVSVFSAGSCESSWCSGEGCYDDDDFDDDDDDNGTARAELPIPSLRLEDFELVTAARSDAHPVARLRRIRGISVSSWTASGEISPDDFRGFTERLLELNDDLIGLPASAGSLRFDGVELDSTSTTVHWRQVREPGPVPGAGIAFSFDLIGRLVEIENSTRLE